MPKLKMSGTTPLPPLYTFMAWTGKLHLFTFNSPVGCDTVYSCKFLKNIVPASYIAAPFAVYTFSRAAKKPKTYTSVVQLNKTCSKFRPIVPSSGR